MTRFPVEVNRHVIQFYDETPTTIHRFVDPNRHIKTAAPDRIDPPPPRSVVPAT
jgi:hypothetical protein